MVDSPERLFHRECKVYFQYQRVAGYVDLAHLETAQLLRNGQRVALSLEHLPGVVEHAVLDSLAKL